MNAYFRGQPIFGQRGPAGPDGNPIGTIISFMGRTAPRDYLVCDGSLYNVSDYPDLADFFEQQFGDKYYFSGKDNQFAVPDMRNLFLRGCHGDADEQLSGEVGEKQEGTIFNNIGATNNSSGTMQINAYAPSRSGSDGLMLFDKNVEPSVKRFAIQHSDIVSSSNSIPARFTARPVNMAVLYCIKATKEKPYEDIYSEEEIIIGRWIDGRPIYRKCKFLGNLSFTINTYTPVDSAPKDIDLVISLTGSFYIGEKKFPIPMSVSAGAEMAFVISGDNIAVITQNSDYASGGKNYLYILEYTKTTDIIPQPVSKVLSPRISFPSSKTIEEDGVEYDYELTGDFVSAASSAAASFDGIGSWAKDIFKEN